MGMIQAVSRDGSSGEPPSSDVSMHQAAEGRGAHGRAAIAQKQIALIGLDHDFRASVISLSLLNSYEIVIVWRVLDLR